MVRPKYDSIKGTPWGSREVMGSIPQSTKISILTTGWTKSIINTMKIK